MRTYIYTITFKQKNLLLTTLVIENSIVLILCSSSLPIAYYCEKQQDDGNCNTNGNYYCGRTFTVTCKKDNYTYFAVRHIIKRLDLYNIKYLPPDTFVDGGVGRGDAAWIG